MCVSFFVRRSYIARWRPARLMGNSCADGCSEPSRQKAGLSAGRTVAGLLDELGVHPRMVVVEHNREILDRSAYGTSPIREGDTLELVHFVGGG